MHSRGDLCACQAQESAGGAYKESSAVEWPARFDSVELRVRVGDGFAVRHGSAAGKQFGEDGNRRTTTDFSQSHALRGHGRELACDGVRWQRAVRTLSRLGTVWFLGRGMRNAHSDRHA